MDSKDGFVVEPKATDHSAGTLHGKFLVKSESTGETGTDLLLLKRDSFYESDIFSLEEEDPRRNFVQSKATRDSFNATQS